MCREQQEIQRSADERTDAQPAQPLQPVPRLATLARDVIGPQSGQEHVQTGPPLACALTVVLHAELRLHCQRWSCCGKNAVWEDKYSRTNIQQGCLGGCHPSLASVERLKLGNASLRSLEVELVVQAVPAIESPRKLVCSNLKLPLHAAINVQVTMISPVPLG